MAIRVKHEGNVTSRITAASAGGRGKRAADDGKAWMQIAASEAQAGNRQLQGTHASPVSPGHASAQLTHAPTGAAPGIMHAPSGAIRGGGLSGRAASASSGSGGGADDFSRRYKVTGADYFQRPDKESIWNWQRRQWLREYLPGEWEAEAQQRIGDVKNAQQMELADHRLGLDQEMYEYKLSAEQKNELAKINSALEDARRSGRFSEDELAELERQAAAKRMGIKPLPSPKEEPPKPNVQMINGRPYVQNGTKWDPVETPDAAQTPEQVYGGTYVDAQGRRWGTDKSGKLYEVGGQKDDFASLLKLVPDTKDDGTPLSMEERLAQMEQIRQMRERFNAPKPDPRLSSTFNPLSPPWMKDAFLRVAPNAPMEADPNVLLTNLPQPARGGAPSPHVQLLRNGAPAPAGAPPAPPSERDKRWSTFKRS